MGLFDFIFGKEDKKKENDSAISTPALPSPLVLEPTKLTGPGSSVVSKPVQAPLSAPIQSPSISREETDQKFAAMKKSNTIDAVLSKLEEKAPYPIPREDAMKIVEADPSIIDKHYEQFSFSGERKKQLQVEQLKKVQDTIGMSFQTKSDPVTGDITVDDDVKEELLNAFYRKFDDEKQGAGGVKGFLKGILDEGAANVDFVSSLGATEETARLQKIQTNDSDLIREFIKTVDKGEGQLLDQYGQADTSISRMGGRLAGILGTSLIPGGTVSKTVRALPFVAALRAGPRTARLTAVVMENVAFSLSAQGFFSTRNGENLKEFTKNVASNPSILLPYHSRWHLVAGFAGDAALGKAMGMSWMDAFKNATIGVGGGFMQRFQTLDDIGLRQLRNRAKEGMDQISVVARTQNASLAQTNSMTNDLVKSLEKEARELGLKPNETRGIFDEGRMLMRSQALPGGQNTPESNVPKVAAEGNVRNTSHDSSPDQAIREAGKHARETLGPIVEGWKKDRDLIANVTDFGEEGAGMAGNKASGRAFRNEMENLARKGAFKFKGISDVGGLDAPSAEKLLQEAWDHHQGKPIQKLIGTNRPKGHDTFSIDPTKLDDGRGLDLFEEGYREGKIDTPNDLLRSVETMIDRDGYENITWDEPFDSEGTTMRQLYNDAEAALNLKQEQAYATRKNNREGTSVPRSNENVRSTVTEKVEPTRKPKAQSKPLDFEGVSKPKTESVDVRTSEDIKNNQAELTVPTKLKNETDSLVREIFPGKEKNPIQSILTKDKAATKRGIKEIIGKPDTVYTRESAQALVRDISKKELDGSMNLSNTKDISSLGLNFTDLFNNTKKVFGRNYQKVKSSLLDPLDESKGQRIDFLTTIKQSLKENVVDKFNIQRRSRESAAIQEYGELRSIDKEEVAKIGKAAAKEKAKKLLVQEFGEKRAKDIIEADSWFRTTYDSLIKQLNDVERKIYPDRDPTPRRQDYYTHFTEITNTFEHIKNAFAGPSQIDPRLVGISETTQPKSRYLSLKQARKGTKTDVDAVTGFLQYIEAVSHGIYIDPHISKFWAFRKSLADAAAESGGDINNYLQFLHDFNYDLLGKSNKLDRAVINLFGKNGRNIVNGIDAAAGRIRANTVLGNQGSALSQFANFPQAVARTSLKNMKDGFTNKYTPLIQKSNFLKERYATSFFEGFEVGTVDNLKKFAKWTLTLGDELTTKTVWKAKVSEAIEKGVEVEKAIIKYADDQTRDLVGGRGVGEIPIALKSKMFKLIEPFQVEVTNSSRLLGQAVSQKQYKVIASTLVANFVINELYQQVTGQRIVYDPVNALLETIQNAEGDDNLGETLYFGFGRQTGELLSSVPGGGFIASTLTGFDNRIGTELFGEGDPGRFGPNMFAKLFGGTAQTLNTFAKEGFSEKTWNAAKKSVIDLFTSGLIPSVGGVPLSPGFGGNQIKKTLGGAEAINDNEVKTVDGKHMFEVDTSNPIDIMKNLIFGKFSTKEAREYFRSKKGKDERDTIEYILDQLETSSSSQNPVLDILSSQQPKVRQPVVRKEVQRKAVERVPVQKVRK